MASFIEEVYSYIKSNAMISPADRIVIGLSGGADSVCLLYSLYMLRTRLGLEENSLVAVHINHMIRGTEADRDESFAADLCDKLGITFVVYRKDIVAYAGEHKLSVEEAGRSYRYECFEEAVRQYSCNKIAVAHNKNDLAETVIFNMIRGSGLKGISGMLPVRGNVIRPLLGVSRAMIESYLSDEGQDYIIDSTNLSLDYDRNKIRHKILPAMEEVNPRAMDHICSMAKEAGNSYDYIHSDAMERYSGNLLDEDDFREVSIDVDQLIKQSPVLQEHQIYEAVAEVAGVKKDIGRKHILSVVNLLYQDTGRQVELPYGIIARKNYEKLIISNKKHEKTEYNLEITSEGVYKIPGWGNLNISITNVDKDLEVSKKIYTKMADYDKIKGKLFLRPPMDGDYIVIDSMGRTKKLSRVFIDNKIDRERRTHWPVVACGSEVLWVVGLRYSEAFKIDDNTTRIICLDYIR